MMQTLILKSLLSTTRMLERIAVHFDRYIDSDDSQVSDIPEESKIFNLQSFFKLLSHLSKTLRDMTVECPWLAFGCYDNRSDF